VPSRRQRRPPAVARLAARGAQHARHPPPAAPTPTEPAITTETGDATTTLTSKLQRLRENVQREESRLEFLRQERTRQETRSRVHTVTDPALREQDRKLEEKIRLNETRLSLLETRLKRGEEDERRQREKIATLTQQLTEMRSSFASASTRVS
jgi:chromosome segregation ATPase